MQFARTLLILPLCAALFACEGGSDEAPGTEATPSAAVEETGSVSILRPDVAMPEEPPVKPPLKPFNAIIPFPKGGAELDAESTDVLGRVMKTEQMALGGPITLRAHTDSSGDDAANLAVAEERGLAVAKWLIARGIAADRITVIALGEQNPLQPNARPDGSPDPAGRAANRRVEIEIGLSEADPAIADPSAGDAAQATS